MEKFQYRKFQAFDEDHSTEVLPQKEENNEKTEPEKPTEEINDSEKVVAETEEETLDSLKDEDKVEVTDSSEEKDEEEKEDSEDSIEEIDESDTKKEEVETKETKEETDEKEDPKTSEEIKESKENSEDSSQEKEEEEDEKKDEEPNPKKEQLRLELTTPLLEAPKEPEKEEDPDFSDYAVPFLEKLKEEESEKKKKPKKVKKKKPKKVYLTKEMWQLLGRLSLLILGCLVVIVGTLYWISPLNTLQVIKVVGNQQLGKEEIIKTSGLKKDDSLWPQVFKKNKIPDKLKKQHPEMKEAKVSYQPFNELTIEAKEYKLDAFLKEGEKYFPILENGYVRKEKGVTRKEDYPVLVDFKKESDILAFLKIYHQLPKEITELIDETRFTGSENDPNQLTLTMTDGNQVIARLGTLMQYLPKYPQVATQMKENGVVDMEAGVFSYPYDNEKRNKEKKEKEEAAKENGGGAVGDDKEEKKQNNGGDFIPDITQLPGQKENH